MAIFNTYSGIVYDATTELPLPGATIELIRNGNPVTVTQADNNGFFSLRTVIPATNIKISHASYKPNTWPANTWQDKYELEQNITELPPVILPPGVPATNLPPAGPGSGLSKNWQWLALGVMAFFVFKK